MHHPLCPAFLRDNTCCRVRSKTWQLAANSLDFIRLSLVQIASHFLTKWLTFELPHWLHSFPVLHENYLSVSRKARCILLSLYTWRKACPTEPFSWADWSRSEVVWRCAPHYSGSPHILSWSFWHGPEWIAVIHCLDWSVILIGCLSALSWYQAQNSLCGQMYIFTSSKLTPPLETTHVFESMNPLSSSFEPAHFFFRTNSLCRLTLTYILLLKKSWSRCLSSLSSS